MKQCVMIDTAVGHPAQSPSSLYQM